MVTRQDYIRAYQKASRNNPGNAAFIHEEVLWELFDNTSVQRDLSPTPAIQFNFKLTALSIEDQLRSRAWGGKCGLFFWSGPTEVCTFLAEELTYMERLFAEDAFLQRRIDDIRKPGSDE